MRTWTTSLFVAAGLLVFAGTGRALQVSTLVELPDFIPDMGTLYVDPATLPAGPLRRRR